MNKKLLFVTVLTMALLQACSSTKKEHSPEDRENDDIKRDYLVRDASSKVRPGWIEDSEVWAKEHGKNIQKFRFFSYETDPKVSRTISCDLAKARAKSDIAGEIATFIDKTIGQSIQGNASIDQNNPNIKSLREYTESNLAAKVQALIHGASIVKTYWEKRKYMKDRGAKRDFTGFTCAVFIRMPTARLTRAIDEAANHVIKQADDPEAKAAVKKALKDASKNFVKAKQGTI